MQQNTSQAPAPQSAVQPLDALIPFPIDGVQGGEIVGLGIRASRKGLVSIDYIARPGFFPANTAMARRVVRQLEQYFADPGWVFDLPLDLKGTDFQLRLWHALAEIPAGRVKTYGALARHLKSGAQAVGQACRRNPVPVVLPCHRVLSLHGVGGYAGAVDGAKLQIKLALLAHENAAHTDAHQGLEPEVRRHET